MDGFLPRPTTGQKHQPPMQTYCQFISRGGMPCMQSAIVLWQIRPSVRPSVRSSFIIFNQSIISIYCSKYMVKRINVNVTQYNVSRTERLKSTNSCPEGTRCFSPSVRPSVCHTLLVYRNERTYRRTLSAIW